MVVKAHFKDFINISFAVISFVSIMYEILFLFTGIYSSSIIAFILNTFLILDGLLCKSRLCVFHGRKKLLSLLDLSFFGAI